MRGQMRWLKPESQKIAPTEENICSVLAVAQQESIPVRPGGAGPNKIAWKIDRRANRCISWCSRAYCTENHLAER
ncbi:MAG: DUF1615 family protein [Enterobacter hormaechei]